MIQAVKGTKDLLNNDIELFRLIEREFINVSEKFGFSEIRTPVIEYTELFKRGIGEVTDIVEKEMFTIIDSKGKNISLRPENTAGVVRAYIQNGLFNAAGLTKLFYIGPMFRRERPQAGRLRQFHQIGCEAFGADSAMLDAETIIYAAQLLKNLKIQKENFEIQISSVGCENCRPEYNKILVDYLEIQKNNICETCNERKNKNPLRVLDCKEEKCQVVIENAPKIIECLCNDCKMFFDELEEYLKIANVDYKINKRLVRGLDYYTRTVFEIVYFGLGAQNAILAGGRYNNLVKQLGGQQTPAVGWAAGIERLVMAIEQNYKFEANTKKNFFLVFDKSVKNKAFEIINRLRENNIDVKYDYESKSFKSQFRLANKLECRFVLILGGDEAERNIIKLKDFSDSSEIEIEIVKLLEKLLKLL